MTRLIHIEASPRREQSLSTAMARYYLDRLRADESRLEIDRLPLWEMELPSFDGDALNAKYARLQNASLSGPQQVAWREIEALVKRLNAADQVLISTPMWNMGVPYRLKHFIDLVTQPGISFAFEPGVGYRPLLLPRPTTVIIASSGDYSSGESYGRPDLATNYLKAALAFIGLTDVEVIPVAPTAGTREAVEHGHARAKGRVDEAVEELRALS